MSKKADWFFMKESKWKESYLALRDIILNCSLTEDLKWGCPCYTHNGKNIVLIHGFKEYCAILFMQGALLKDSKKLLIQQTVNVQAARQMRFTDALQVHKLKTVIVSYIKEAIQNEESGRKVVLKKLNKYPVPAEFEKVLKNIPGLKKAFASLTPGRQKAYLFYFRSAKLSVTREGRIKKYIPKILEGKGLED
jgi:uncharacterized protein YdeI (YjbR/CyaY-like superfamily)